MRCQRIYALSRLHAHPSEYDEGHDKVHAVNCAPYLQVLTFCSDMSVCFFPKPVIWLLFSFVV